MRRKKETTRPEIYVSDEYGLEEVLDTDDSGYDFEDAILYEEVDVEYERDENTKQRV